MHINTKFGSLHQPLPLLTVRKHPRFMPNRPLYPNMRSAWLECNGFPVEMCVASAATSFSVQIGLIMLPALCFSLLPSRF